MCSGAGRDRTLAGFYVLCLQLVGAAFMAARGRPQGWPLRPDTLGRACSAEVNAPGRGSRFILGWRVFHGNLFGSVFLPCLRRPRFLAEESGGKDGSGRGIPISPAPTPHPLKRPIRGAAAPLLDVPPREGRTPRRFSYWRIGLVPLFRRGAHRAPAGHRSAVIRRGGYHPPAIPVLSPSVGAGPRPARRCMSGNDGMGMFRLRAGYFPGKESSQSSPGLRARTQEHSSDTLTYAAGAEAS